MGWDNKRLEAWIYDGTDMTIRDYFALAISKKEPGLTFADCVHDFAAGELDEIVNASSVTAFHSKDDSFVYERHVWSRARVYFVCADGTQQVQSRPRNP